jgi:two-component system chemotaxis sensor kinase CheA
MLPNDVQSIMQSIATELAFVETSGASSLKQIGEFVLQIKRTYGTTNAYNINEELNWFDFAQQTEYQGLDFLPIDKLDALHQWYERLEAALYQYNQSLHQETSTAAALLEQPALTSEGPVPPLLDHESPLVLNIEDDADLLHEFCNEGRDLLHNIEQGILVLEDNPHHAETLNLVFRAFHTFKGNAGFLGLSTVKNLAHELESLLDAARKGTLPITTVVIELILAGADTFKHFIDHIAQRLQGATEQQLPPIPTLALIEKVQACLRSELVTTTTPPSPPQPPEQSNVVESSQLTELRQPQVLDLTPPEPTPISSANTLPPSPQIIGSENLPSFVKLKTEKVDALVDLVGELLIAQSMVVQHPEVLQSSDRDLARYLRQLARITTDLQKNAMSLRMVPIRGAFQKMNRLVRDLAASQGKHIQLHLSGEEIELDRNIVEQLADPLIHMVRNAIDHGIEQPELRVQRGKPVMGTIHLQAMHQGGGIVIRIRDDGKGMDKHKILAKATERGLVNAEFIPNDKDIFDLIFAPGFSTADTITDISGRGVGMDVVRGCITRLRGRIEVESEVGLGSTFTIRLPLTLAIIDGMLVSIGNERFIIPTLSIRESFRPQPDMLSTVQGSAEVLRVRGKLIPLVRLADQLSLQGACQNPCDGIVIVTESGSKVQGLLVDKLIGKKEVVIKSLGDRLMDQPGISGAAILGDGMVTLILDPDALGSGFAAQPLAH